MADRERPAAYRPVAITLAGGESVSCWQEGDDVVVAVDLGTGRDGSMVKVPAPAVAYLAGALAVMSGVHVGSLMDTPAVTITAEQVCTWQCPHCQAETVQVAGGAGTPTGACLQCIADGGTCCSLAPLNRWKAPNAR